MHGILQMSSVAYPNGLIDNNATTTHSYCYETSSNESQHSSFNGTTRQTSFMGATSVVQMPTSSRVYQSVNTVDVGLHKQWGLIWNNPLSAVVFTQSQTIDTKDMKQWIKLAHTEVAKHNCPNYRGPRVKVRSQLNVPQWRALSKDYKINRVVDFVEYGFPLSIDHSKLVHTTEITNHKSALFFPEAVDNYLEAEIGHSAIVGPFEDAPFNSLHVSLMMARPKADRSRSLIVDLSWPQGAGVNECLMNDLFDSEPCLLKYPTIDVIVDTIQDTGSVALAFKIDLKRACGNLRADPLDVRLLGRRRGRRVSSQSLQCLLITTLGLPINNDNVSTPVDQLTCLGINVNAKTGVLSIPRTNCRKSRHFIVCGRPELMLPENHYRS